MRDVVLALDQRGESAADCGHGERGIAEGAAVASAHRAIPRLDDHYSYRGRHHPGKTMVSVLIRIVPADRPRQHSSRGAHVVSFQCSAERGLMGRLLRFYVAMRDDEDTRLDVARRARMRHDRTAKNARLLRVTGDSASGEPLHPVLRQLLRSRWLAWRAVEDDQAGRNRTIASIDSFLRFERRRLPWSYGHGGGSKYQFVASA